MATHGGPRSVKLAAMAARVAAVLFLLTLAAPAFAETYKWVDERGVVNYSNAPPAGAAVKAKAKTFQEVEDRLSSYETDPSLKSAAAYRGPSYYEQQAEREWLQRQRLMASSGAAAQAAPCVAPYRGDCDDYSAGYYPYAPLV